MFTIDPEEGLVTFTERVLAAAAENVIDLGRENLYAIGHPLHSTFNGVCGPAGDRIFFPEIAAAGKYHGRGIAVVIDTAKIYGKTFAACRAAGIGETEADRHSRLTLTGILLHELTHGIQNGRDGEQTLLSEGVDVARDAFERVFVDEERPQSVENAPPPIEPWKGHGLAFVRGAAILHSRVTPELPIRLADIVESANYGLSPVRTYYNAIRADGDLDEPDTVPIRHIISRAAGPVLEAKWKADIFKWFQSTPMGEAETKAAERALAQCGPSRARAATALASQDYLPQPNEHFAETRPPEAWQHDTFEAVDMADGVRSLHARLRDGDDNEPKPATLYFDDDKFTVAEAQTWMHRRGITFASIRASKNATYPQLTS